MRITYHGGWINHNGFVNSPVFKPQKPDHTVPEQLSKEMLAGNWDISDVSAQMVKAFKEKYNLK